MSKIIAPLIGWVYPAFKLSLDFLLELKKLKLLTLKYDSLGKNQRAGVFLTENISSRRILKLPERLSFKME